ncbi:unnamed protein product [Aureobasidium mustum]|uniref:Trafficking protein particle complex II-specific subunit 65 IgD3 domain-containing protein n=1 Tax=Aureobasidium mustum TaxID=2773714 RepID=A0A9N8K098_9PEZI|nr:unnamed protein product [Aureobasidium mustum]
MTSTTAESQPTLSFPDACTLDLIIPNSSDFDVETHLKTDNQLVSRDVLFFDCFEPTISSILTDPQGGTPGGSHNPRGSSAKDIIEALQRLSSFGAQNEIKAEGSSLTVEPLSADLAALNIPTTLQTGDKSTFLPLPPGACHNVQLEFLTLSTGLVGLAAVHVVDLDSRETTQITELPDVLVTK